jgi:hypothetical protein
VQAETTRTRLRRSCGISSDRSVISPPAMRENRQSLLTRHPPRFTCPKEGNCRSRNTAQKNAQAASAGPRPGIGRRRLQHQAAAVVILPWLLQAAHERRNPPFRRRRTTDYGTLSALDLSEVRSGVFVRRYEQVARMSAAICGSTQMNPGYRFAHPGYAYCLAALSPESDRVF